MENEVTPLVLIRDDDEYMPLIDQAERIIREKDTPDCGEEEDGMVLVSEILEPPTTILAHSTSAAVAATDTDTAVMMSLDQVKTNRLDVPCHSDEESCCSTVSSSSSSMLLFEERSRYKQRNMKMRNKGFYSPPLIPRRSMTTAAADEDEEDGGSGRARRGGRKSEMLPPMSMSTPNIQTVSYSSTSPQPSPPTSYSNKDEENEQLRRSINDLRESLATLVTLHKNQIEQQLMVISSHDSIAAVATAAAAVIPKNEMMMVAQQQQQQQPVVQANPFPWCTCETNPERIRAAFYSMQLQEPANVPIDIQITNFSISHEMFGINTLSALVAAKLVKPIMEPTLYTESVRNIKHPLNFAVVGPPGSGKRTALKLACSMCNVCYVCVSENNYTPTYITMATQYARQRRPFLLYIDGLDTLWHSSMEFQREFDISVLRNEMFNGEWCNVWLVLGVSSLRNDAVRSVVSRVCLCDNIAYMQQPSSEDLVNMLLRIFQDRKMTLLPEDRPLTDEDWYELRSAAEGSTPADINAFAGRVIASALDYLSLDDMRERVAQSPSSVVLTVGSTATSGGSTKPITPLVANNVISRTTPLRNGNTGSSGGNGGVGGANKKIYQLPVSTQLTLEGTSSASMMRPSTRPVIWKRDAVPKYTTIDASANSSGLSKRIIPRCGASILCGSDVKPCTSYSTPEDDMDILIW